MGLVRSAFSPVYETSGLDVPERWLLDWAGGDVDATAGVWVDEQTALTYGPFWAGVRVISEDVASLPLIAYRRLARGRERAVDHPLFNVLGLMPNPYMSSLRLRETLQGHALTWGNGYAQIVRDGAGNVDELWPLRPDRTRVRVIRTDVGRAEVGRAEVWYEYTDPHNNIHALLHPSEVLHIAGLGFDGLRGYSVVHMARKAIGLGLATETYGAGFFANGSRPGGILTHPEVVSDDARKRMRRDWESMHRGPDAAARLAILEEGVTWQAIGIPPEDAQFLETRKLQVTEMARWLRLPPHKIGDLERSTFSNIEQQQLDYVSTALRSWLVRWEQEIAIKLLTAPERATYYAEHLVDGLLRGDTLTRYQAYAIGRQWGWLSADDIAELENRNPLPGGQGDLYLVPMNMVTAASLTGPPPADPPRALEMRGRGTQARKRIAASFAPMITDADERLAKLERAEVKALVRRHLDRGRSRSLSVFLADLSELYSDAGTITQKALSWWLPIFDTFAAQIAEDAAADVAYDDEVDLSTWVAAYVASHIGYRTSSSFGQLRGLTETTDAEGLVAALLARLDTWVSDRPARTAAWETTQLPNAAARETWRDAGVRTLRWVTVGEDCPYCARLDGRAVGIAEPFAAAGEQFDDGDQALKIGRNIHHPPLHPGCNCDVVPG